MSAMKIQNGQSFLSADIEYARGSQFIDNVASLLSEGHRLVGLFPPAEKDPRRLLAVLADPDSAQFVLCAGEFDPGKLTFESMAKDHPQTAYFECELAEKYGYIPANHPWLRPVRGHTLNPSGRAYRNYQLEGDEVHEVAVGPIHAGVIEPGHFRFQCHGETVYNLEINLGYQRRGVEKLIMESEPAKRIMLAESAAGDTVIGHAYAHCAAMESLSDAQIGLRAHVIRSIAEELERTAMHLAGLGGIANDIGFALASASYGRLRTLAINSFAALCGSRFGRGLLTYGGVRFDFDDEVIADISAKLDTIAHDVAEINDVMFSLTGALIRFENTGTVTKETAEKIGMVGIAARASGVETDTRVNRPYGAYRYSPISLLTIQSGDVFARARLRALEMYESLRFIKEQIETIPGGAVKTGTGEARASSGVISVVEGWRGEIMHAVFTGADGKIAQYKIKDPSFNNWHGLSAALRGTAISDFPLCNKSFDLSYAGHDL